MILNSGESVLFMTERESEGVPQMVPIVIAQEVLTLQGEQVKHPCFMSPSRPKPGTEPKGARGTEAEEIHSSVKSG